ncbi:GNAT family N-acetyltransferase [Catenuloplanes atrovinosus]|uniref:GNAT superfamily N-acetyltransferase n=1 Tax=Catenuloplanes atrovinosus TaxID=137266 RepID=A0AAE4C7Z7_9ACTN|nr:GNAT family N-acetyltransferase [Catenuloplanes atrovinosus]MDR7274453.1 GNAT superfamily N-acetyltransferase [Catenuloplanes atrovinosus]
MTMRAMHAGEFGAFRASVVDTMVESMVTAIGVGRDAARAQAVDGVRTSLPLGFDTPEHVLLVGEVDGARVGAAWFGIRHPRGVEGCAFLHMLLVDPAHRGHGLGHALLDGVEAEARARGARAMELHVFGFNAPATALYRSSGYEVITQQMRKTL